MVKSLKTIEKDSHVNFKELTLHILQSYLDASNDNLELLSLLDESMSVIGTGKQEFLKIYKHLSNPLHVMFNKEIKFILNGKTLNNRSKLLMRSMYWSMEKF